MSITPPTAELKGVSKRYGKGATRVHALTKVDLQLRPGELVLIEGPSGSGKTTLLHLLGLLQRPDEGEVWLGGRRMDHLPESHLPDARRQEAAFIFQGYNLLEALTLRDNVAVAGTLNGVADRRFPAEAYLARLGLAERTNHLPSDVSGGEKQRAAIARALACGGRLVLADEPTANLDWANAQEVMRRLADLAHREQRAVVMVSHDSRLEPFVDRVVTLLNGQVDGDRYTSQHVWNVPMADEDLEVLDEIRKSRRPHSAWSLLIGIVLGVLITVVCLFAYRQLATGPALPSAGAETHVASDSGDVTPYVAAAPAVVEPSTQLVALRSERRGRITEVRKQAGERIRRGEVLVVLDDTTSRAVVAQKQAELELAEADLAQLQAWDRAEERAKRKAGVERAQARLDRARRELERVQALHDRTAAPVTELNDAIEEQRLAAAALEEAEQTWKISEAGPTAEELGVARARVTQARAALQVAKAQLGLCTIVSPLDGHVVYRHLEPGEVVDPEMATPILSLGNLDSIRLRAEVDEADIERVFVGQEVVATAEAHADREFRGRVVHLEPMMGRKSIRTERTTEQQDTKVREVLIELDTQQATLPIDLQMTVRFLDMPMSRPATSGD